MVQVDVFWSYAIGAGFAASAARQLKDEPSTTQNSYFTKTALFLAIIFAPSGAMLLWAFTGWETMYLWDRETLPNWIVPLFSITNVTQGLLGFWVAHILIKKGNLLWAHLQWVLGYLAMFFILVHGWDGLGYRRFFTYTMDQAALATDSAILTRGFGPSMALRWSISPVALTLYAMGLIMLPVMFYMIGTWARKGYSLGGVDAERARKTTAGDIVMIVCRVVFIWTLGSAIVWSLLIHLLGWGWGTIVFGPLFAFLGLGPFGIIRKEVDRITLENGADVEQVGAARPAET